MTSPSRLLTITQAAIIYGCSRSNMHYLVNTGRIPSIRVGNIVKLSEESLRECMGQRAARKYSNVWIKPVGEGV